MFAWLFSTTTLSLCTISISVVYFYVKFVYSYWRRRGVPYVKPSFPFGNFGQFSFRRFSIGAHVLDLYHRTTEPFFGCYSFLRPTFVVRDANLVHNILHKDCDHFINRGGFIDAMNDPLSAHLFALNGRQWKDVRKKLTIAFTTAKMRQIFATLMGCKNPLQKLVKRAAKENEAIDIGEMTTAFTTNAIASIAFGIDVNCFSDPENPLRNYGRKVFTDSLKGRIRAMCHSLCPQLCQWIGIRSIDGDVQEFFHDLVRQILHQRKTHDIRRNDFFNLLMQMHETGTVQLNDEWNTVMENGCSSALSVEQMAAESFLFYVVGCEKTAATMSFCLYEIAKNQFMQQRVIDEIDEVLARVVRQQQQRQNRQLNADDNSEKDDGNQFTYDAIAELKYLDCCIDGSFQLIFMTFPSFDACYIYLCCFCLAETLRKYPVAPILPRQCTKDYKISSKVTIERGTFVIIPIYSLHRDPDIFAEPEIFEPNRYYKSRSSSISSIGSNNSSKNQTFNQKKSSNPPPYLPFGGGPRTCIGRRLAKMLIKVGIAAILQKCCIELTDAEQRIEPKVQFFTPFGDLLRPQTGLQLRFKTRKVLVSTHRVDFLDMIDFSTDESQFSRAVRAAQPMRPVLKSQRPTIAACRKRMSLR